MCMSSDVVCGEAKGLYNPSYSDVETVHDGEEFFSRRERRTIALDRRHRKGWLHFHPRQKRNSHACNRIVTGSIPISVPTQGRGVGGSTSLGESSWREGSGP